MHMRNLGDFRNGLYGSHFVVGQHHGNHAGFRANGVFNRRRINTPMTIDRHIAHLIPELFQRRTGVQNRMVFNLSGHDMFFSGHSAHRAEQRPVVGFRSAAREIDFGRFGVNGVRNLPTRSINRRPRAPPFGIKRVGVRRMLRKIREHGVQRFRPERRCRRMIQIDHVFLSSQSEPILYILPPNPIACQYVKKRAMPAFPSAEVCKSSRFCSRGRFYAIVYTQKSDACIAHTSSSIHFNRKRSRHTADAWRKWREPPA